ncbi:MAG: tRNA 4-thiouridine(8) synthase ThiI [Pseudomonadota bacterium]
MKTDKTSRQIKGLGLCSGGLDSILSALILQRQGIETTWICFETPFFSSQSAQKAAHMTGIPLITMDITQDYMEMMKAPKAGFGKNMNPCMDCHALMFAKAGELLKEKGFDFLFSGEVLGQRPKSQNKDSLRYVEKNSGFDGQILRPLCARRLPETRMEQDGLVDREQLLDITGRSRKVQMQLAKEFGIKEFPPPAGGCLLTDKNFSNRLRDLMVVQKKFETRELFFLQSGRHFRLDDQTKIMVGRSLQDNANLLKYTDPRTDIVIQPSSIAGPDTILTGNQTQNNIQTAAMICAGYTKAAPGEITDISVTQGGVTKVIRIKVVPADGFKHLMI